MKTTSLMIMALTILLGACSSDRSEKDFETLAMQEVTGRDEGSNGRFPLYRVKVPDGWIRRDPLPDESLTDTKKALCEFIIVEGDGTIRIALHNFPSDNLDGRIPPAAQVARWRSQFDSLDPVSTSTLPQSFSGYSGLLFMGNGVIKGEASMMMAWALQLPAEHYRALTTMAAAQRQYAQMRADVTIKAVGPKNMMNEHKKEIVAFARSFELIEEIPARQ